MIKVKQMQYKLCTNKDMRNHRLWNLKVYIYVFFVLFFQVLSWIIYGGLFSYVKISIAGICRQTSNSALFWCGAVTQIGSAFGALLMFILVNVASGIFTAYYVTCE